MKCSGFLTALIALGAVAVTSTPATAREGDLNVTIGEPGYYQPNYEQRGYRNQPDWEQERQARHQRAMEWRDHRGDNRDSNRSAERREEHRDQQRPQRRDDRERGNNDDRQH